MSKKILIVEDEPMLAELLFDVLENAGYTCSSAPSGKTALSKLQSEPVDFIISDLTMADGDGYFLLDQLVKNEIKTPIGICTGIGYSDTLDNLMEKGAVMCFKKPYSLRKLAQDLDKYFEKSVTTISEIS